MIGDSDIEVANNIVHYRRLHQLQRLQLVTDKEIMSFIETKPMEFRPMPRIQDGSIRTSGEMNRVYERLDAITILAKELTGLM